MEKGRNEGSENTTKSQRFDDDTCEQLQGPKKTEEIEKEEEEKKPKSHGAKLEPARRQGKAASWAPPARTARSPVSSPTARALAAAALGTEGPHGCAGACCVLGASEAGSMLNGGLRAPPAPALVMG